MSSLLEKAKKEQKQRKNNVKVAIENEHIELALAWALGEVKQKEVARVLDYQGPSTYVVLARALAEHIRRQEKYKKADELYDRNTDSILDKFID